MKTVVVSTDSALTTWASALSIQATAKVASLFAQRDFVNARRTVVQPEFLYPSCQLSGVTVLCAASFRSEMFSVEESAWPRIWLGILSGLLTWFSIVIYLTNFPQDIIGSFSYFLDLLIIGGDILRITSLEYPASMLSILVSIATTASLSAVLLAVEGFSPNSVMDAWIHFWV